VNSANPMTASEFRRSVILLSYVFSVPALAIVYTVLLILLDMTAMQWWWFFGSTGVYGILCSYPLMQLQKRMLSPVTEYLDCSAANTATPEIRRAAFKAVMRLPFSYSVFGAVNWIAPSAVAAIVLALSFESFGSYEAAVMLLAGTAAACITGSFNDPLIKRRMTPLREALAGEIEDPDERSELITRRPLRDKMFFSMVSVTMLPVIFAALLFNSESNRALDELALASQQDVVESIQGRLESQGLAAASAAALGDSADDLEIVLLDLYAPNDGLILSDEIFADVKRSVAAGNERGNSEALPADRNFSWRRIDNNRLLIAVSAVDHLRVDTRQMWLVVAVLLLFSGAIGWGLFYLLADDVGRSTEGLRAEADRLASGDLRQGRMFESEDELGDLSRAFEGMASALRSTVARVAETADRVESAAGEISASSESVTKVTAEQVIGIERTNSSMDAIDEKVRGIADSAQSLNVSVEESSSTILELGASSDELNETASTLSARVADVSGSIEQMVRSVREVSERGEELSEASIETSTSMEEMAASLSEVDASAEEAARLSSQVVQNAEVGQERVRQTIEGMEEIRESTETAVRVIRNLGSRTKEIGAIVDVIDDVADETNLLALNAAIIAAQAGDQGRAFSVVADEIKDLADRVLASTKEIGTLVRSVQDEVGNAIGAVERGAESVASGVDLSAEAGLSLEEITRASRTSGTRIEGIVTAVREQSKAASHVVALMERVRSGSDSIRSAAKEQDCANEAVHRNTLAMRGLSQQVRGTTEEQARGSGRIRESIEAVQEVVEQINGALQEQTTACSAAVEFLEEMYARTKSNDYSARRLDEATKGLLRQAETLREDMQRFRI
jgi:methyl-accepting chemotaxis protein